jgi:ABC-type branched-subunit amino acid transport system substrate-binding protein
MADRNGTRWGRGLAALAPATWVVAGAGAARAADTTRAGFMAPMTGIFAQAGKDVLEGLKLAFEQIGCQAAGRKIELKLAAAKVGKTPAYFTAIMCSAGRWVAEAAKIVDGKVEDRERFLAAIKKASETIEDPRGPIKLDERGNPTTASSRTPSCTRTRWSPRSGRTGPTSS